MIKYKYSILALLLAGTIIIASACKTSDNERNNDTSKCIDGIELNYSACAAICETSDNKESCESTVLPQPENQKQEAWSYSHKCIWYEGQEVSLNNANECVFGEKRGACGYAHFGEVDCGGSGILCDDKWIGQFQYGAGYFVEDNKIFMFVNTCVPVDVGSFGGCYMLPPNAIDECVCGCEMDAGVNYD